MQSNKVTFLLFVAVSSTLVAAETGAKCECGVFKKQSKTETPLSTTCEAPVASKSPQFDFKCDSEGKQNCLNMCKALAEASREDGPKKLCELLKDTTESFTPLVYYKACQDLAWTYSGLKPTLEVCCKNKEVVPCA